MLSLLSWLVTGLVIGLIARAIVPGRQAYGIGVTIALGIIGAAAGGFISSLMWPGTMTNEMDTRIMWPGWLMAVGGGVLVVWAYTAFTNRNEVTQPTTRTW